MNSPAQPSDSSRKEAEEIERISAALHAREQEIGRLKAYFCESHLPTPANEYKRCGWCAYSEMRNESAVLQKMMQEALEYGANRCSDGELKLKCTSNGNRIGRQWGGRCPFHRALDAQGKEKDGEA